MSPMYSSLSTLEHIPCKEELGCELDSQVSQMYMQILIVEYF